MCWKGCVGQDQEAVCGSTVWYCSGTCEEGGEGCAAGRLHRNLSAIGEVKGG